LIVGFAAETENRMENGRAKLLRKGADAIVVNNVAAEGIGFEADNNAATFLTLTTAIELPEMSKRSLADRILDEILTLRRPSSMLLEMDEGEDEKRRQDRVRSETLVSAASRRQLIIE
jgi:phosphopantothenoylcysteine decarboxylase/phosphopantothenate--cysteine ligase